MHSMGVRPRAETYYQKISWGTAELIMSHVPRLTGRGRFLILCSQIESCCPDRNVIAVMPDGKKARYDSQKAGARKWCPCQGRWKYWNTIQPLPADGNFSRRGCHFIYMNFPGGVKLPIPDIVFKIDKPLILGHPLIGFAVIIRESSTR